MTPEEARKNLRDLELREFAYNHAAGMLYFDGVTAAPKGTYISRGKTLSVLNEAAYSLSNSEEARETLRVLSEHMDELTPAEQRIVELREKALRFRSRVPVDEYVAYQELLNEAATVWREAKATSDYAMFEPLLQRIIDACRRFAELVEPETDPYDFWLDNYEEGMTQEFCDRFFAELRAKLVPLIAKVGAAEEYSFTQLGRGVSMGVHESQSRFFENIIGRSRAFCSLAWPELVRLSPELGRYDAYMFYRAVNAAQPGLIRIEADELTYSLHIMVRYELERAMLHGELNAKELPERWNALYKQYLGVDVPDDARGVLQDSHWSGGQLGYFPSYALGSAYGAQLVARMKEGFDVDAAVASGDLAPVRSWLGERIWSHGSLRKPTELMRSALGGEFDASWYTNYLEAKMREVYKL